MSEDFVELCGRSRQLVVADFEVEVSLIVSVVFQLVQNGEKRGILGVVSILTQRVIGIAFCKQSSTCEVLEDIQEGSPILILYRSCCCLILVL